MITAFVSYLVELSRRFAWLVIATVLLATIGLGWFVATHFRVNTDVNQLLAADLPWRQREAEMEKAFPQKVDVLLVVIDADSPDAADAAASKLAARLRAMPDLFSYVEQPDAIPFFRKNGLLLLPMKQFGDILKEFVRAQPILGALAADPSLRGLFSIVGRMAQGVAAGATEYKELEKPFAAIADTIDKSLAGQDRLLPWQTIMADKPPEPEDLRKLIVTKPVLDYGDLEPGRQASEAIRTLAKELNLTPDHGIRVRLTGSVALNDEEFASVANGTGFATLLSAVLVIVILWLALRSVRLIVPILLTLFAGLIMTTAVALAAIGSLNLISVAFAVMFIGIAVDFGIQFGVRYRGEHFEEPDHTKAMQNTSHIIAVPLAMAAASTSFGFLAFMPTDYRGVSELGFIAGIGMIIAFLLNITFFPALLAFFKPPAEREPVGFRWAAPIDRFVQTYRREIVGAAFVALLVGGAITTRLQFDFDPLDLKDKNSESVSTLFDLMKDPNFSVYTIDILEPTLEDMRNVSARLEKLPEVDHTLSLLSFVPDDQDAKLALLNDTRMLLAPTLNPPSVMPPPSDEQILSSLSDTAKTLHDLGKKNQSAETLAKALDAVVARHDHDLLERLRSDLIGGLLDLLDAARESLKAERIAPENITEDLRRDWVTPDGRFLLQVYPKGNVRNENTLIAFTDAVRRIVPDISGPVVSIRESGRTVTSAFIHAGCYAFVTIMLIAYLMLRRLRDVVMLVSPLILAGILTLATIVVIGLPLNFANIIALPLLLSLGVSYAIYFVSYWRAGMTDPLQSSMARAVLFSASTTLVAFGTLGLSSHPGTSGMGKLLTVALLYSLTCTFFILPALLGLTKADRNSIK